MNSPIFDLLLQELCKADFKHGPMSEQMEGLYTLRCEVMELAREVHRKNQDPTALTKEAIQVATMAVKFLRDCCGLELLVYEPIPENKQVSQRGRDWQEFSAKVLNHIEKYTVPQYGDKGSDRASEYNITEVADHIGRYRDRMKSNARGKIEAKRDMLKIAHYASFGYDLI